MAERDPIGFVIALPLECRSLTRQKVRRLATVELHGRCLIRISGSGGSNAEAAADELVARGARQLVSWGCAGALADHLAPGDVILPASVRTSDGSQVSFCGKWRRRLAQSVAEDIRIDEGSIAESADIVDTVAGKSRLRDATGAVAVDMESAAVLRVAKGHNVPCIAVRAIADNASTPVPRSVLRSVDPHGEVRLARLIIELARDPSELVGLTHLNRCFRAALRSLSRVAELAGPSLAA